LLFFAPLLAGVSLSGWTDARKHLVPNVLTLPVLLVGSLCQVCRGSWQDLVWGLAVGGGLGFAAWLAGGLGGGDMKLMAAVGAWLGPRGSLDVFLVAAVIGAAWGAAKLARLGLLKQRMLTFVRGLYLLPAVGLKGMALPKLPENPADPVPPDAVPFGACIALAVWLYALRGMWG
jgi:leader peptidase (prepilin peptidase)/N-methyltransferase